MSKKRIMRSLKINEVAGVDFPAQEGGLVVLLKRAEDNDKEKEIMTAEEIAKAKADHEAEVAKLKADLALAKSVGELTDAQKAHYAGLDEADKAKFLKAKPAEREAQLAKAKESDPVVYTDLDGVEYRKSDDARLVAAAKRADSSLKAARLSEERAQASELQKRAEVLLKNLPGEINVKTALLKAVDGIQEEAVRTKVLDLLKVNGEKLAEAFKERGTSTGKVADNDPNTRLEALAKKYAADNKVDMVKARVEVLNTTEGQALYNETLARV